MPKQLTILLLGLVLLLIGEAVSAANLPILLEMQKQEGLNRTRVSLLFDRLPEFKSEHSGERLDILLNQTVVSSGLLRLPEDETVVKILLAEKGRDLLVSLRLRRPPKQVVSTSQKNPARIDFDLYWDSARGSRPAVAFRIEGIPGRRGGRKVRARQTFPPWKQGWRAMFTSDVMPWTLDPEANFTLPVLPPLRVENPTPELTQRLAMAAKKHWLRLLRLPLMDPVTQKEQTIEQLLLIEGLLRTGEVDAAGTYLLKLKNLRGQYRTRVDYLTDFSLANSGQSYAAYLKLASQLKKKSIGDPFYPFLTLLTVETALASENDKAAAQLLAKSDIPWPKSLQPLLLMRRGDVACGLGHYTEALGWYRTVLNNSKLLDLYPRSLNCMAQAAFKLGKYPLAARFYQELGRQLIDHNQQALAFFSAAAADYDAGKTDLALRGLLKVSLKMPGTEGADRAALRLLDHQVLAGDDHARAESVYQYAKLAKKAQTRALREEAAFKQALVLYLLGDQHKSIQLLMDFKRSFAHGPLRPAADSLLREQLPAVIAELIDKGQNIPAMVLVEQNRKLLLKGKIDASFLDRVSAVFARLGLFKRAARVLLFQLDRATSSAQRERFYLPLTQLYLLRREYRSASEYARNYLATYPHGKRRGRIYGLLIESLEKQKRTKELLQQLVWSGRPHSARLDIQAAWIYWQQRRLGDVVQRLQRARKRAGSLPVKDLALLAESFYQLGRNKLAEKNFRNLLQDKKFGAQASYRNAQLLLHRGKKMEGLKLLQNLVEKDNGGAWEVLAQDLLKGLNSTKF